MENLAITSTPVREQARISIEPNDTLVFPNHRRTFSFYSKDNRGSDLLVIYTEGGEISFDEPELFAFGETLSKESKFLASSALTWGNGYRWDSIQPLLNSLVEEGVLQKTMVFANAVENGHRRRVQRNNDLLAPAPNSIPRTWFDCESITREITGRSIELGYLELIIPMFRIAHIAVDSDGRQVGEANVFPSSLRMETETEWRSCHYAGSRYQGEHLMNATALRVMSKHWSEIMLCIKCVRDAYLLRFEDASEGLTLGDLERLTIVVLALPTFQLMRSENNVGNGELHPVLSSVFRVTDGVRQTAHQMLFQPNEDEPSCDPNMRIFSSDIHAYAERRNSFFSAHGVCAGPRIMIEQLLNALINGQIEKDASEAVFSAPVSVVMSDLNPVLDYGFRSLQAFAIVHSMWTVMVSTYYEYIQFGLSLPDNESTEMTAFKMRLNTLFTELQDSLLNSEQRRADRESIYADMYYQCSLGLEDEETIAARLNPGVPEAHPIVYQLLTESIGNKLSTLHLSNSDLVNAYSQINRLVDSLLTYLCYEQAVLKAGGEIQTLINKLLGRDCAKKRLRAADLGAILGAETNNDRKNKNDNETLNIGLQALSAEIHDVFAVQINVTSDSITGCRV